MANDHAGGERCSCSTWNKVLERVESAQGLAVAKGGGNRLTGHGIKRPGRVVPGLNGGFTDLFHVERGLFFHIFDVVAGVIPLDDVLV